MDWAEKYLSDCLSGIPKSEFRNRLQSELADHLALLARDLEAADYSTAEARTEALRQMGDAGALNAGYRAAWLRRPERRRWDLSRMVCGCVIAGVFSFFGFVTLGTLWDAWSGPLRDAPMWIFGALLFGCAAVPNALFLRSAFRARADRRARIIAGMLLMWCVGTGLMLLGFAVLYGHIFPLPAYNHRLVGTPDGYWAEGSFRWFTNFYLAWTFPLSPLVGWLFAAYKRGEKEAACDT